MMRRTLIGLAVFVGIVAFLAGLFALIRAVIPYAVDMAYALDAAGYSGSLIVAMVPVVGLAALAAVVIALGDGE